mmetsp:Transcript_101055/g.257048  ORF Transcript_101055/g.257048 Transcript_101055/m.257048 type:complete len:228 (+) Transcript_101055:610-1293(+)
MDQQQGSLLLRELLRIQKRRHRGISVRGLPIGALLALKTEGRQCSVVCTTAADARSKQVGVREQVCRHVRAVAVSSDADAVPIYNAELVDHAVHGRLRVQAELLDEGVVRLGLALADDGHLGVVEDGVAAEQPEGRSAPAAANKGVGRTRNLPRSIRTLELPGVGPHQARQPPIPVFVVAGWQVQLSIQLHAVAALVFHELLPHVSQSGLRVLKSSDRNLGLRPLLQ